MEAPQKKKKKITYAFCNAEPQDAFVNLHEWKLLVECQAAPSLR